MAQSESLQHIAPAGAEVTYAEASMGHQIDPSFLGRLEGWVQGVLP